MDLEIYSKGDVEAQSRLSKELDSFIAGLKTPPIFIVESSYIGEGDDLVVAREDDGTLCGLLIYSPVIRTSGDTVYSTLEKFFQEKHIQLYDGSDEEMPQEEIMKIPFFNSFSGNQPLIYFDTIEAFRPGVGRLMVNFLQDQDNEGIFGFAYNDSEGFHKKCGFDISDSYHPDCSSENHLITWKKS